MFLRLKTGQVMTSYFFPQGFMMISFKLNKFIFHLFFFFFILCFYSTNLSGFIFLTPLLGVAFLNPLFMVSLLALPSSNGDLCSRAVAWDETSGSEARSLEIATCRDYLPLVASSNLILPRIHQRICCDFLCSLSDKKWQKYKVSSPFTIKFLF